MSRFSSPADRSVSIRSLASLFFLFALVIVWGAGPAARGFLPGAALPDFGAPVFYPELAAGPYNRAIATGDLNGDRRADLIVGQTVGVKVAFGDGRGGMSAGTPAGTGATPNSIAVADLDGDGDIDIVTSNQGGTGNTFSVLFNNGSGTFGVENTYTMPAGHKSLKVTTGDVTGDGRPEVVALSDKLVTIWTNNGAGSLTLGFSRVYATPSCCYNSGYSAVRVAKVTTDQHADLVLTVNTYDYGNEPQLQIMPGTGGGNFGSTTYHRYPNVPTTNRPAFHTIEVEVADVDNDGDVDVIAGAQSSHNRRGAHLVVMRNDGTGAYPPTSGSSHNVGFLSGSVMAGDLNDDGNVDILSVGYFAYFLNDGAGNFPTGVPKWNVPSAYSAALADLNGSGQGTLDVVMVRDQAVFTLMNGTIRDSTPPVVAATVTGTLTNGWYTSDVTVSWSVTDPESTPSSACPTQTVTSDTAATTFTCSATSLGGTTTESVTIKRDTTAPSIATASANPGSLWPPNNKMVAVRVSVDASDAGSGGTTCSIDSVNSNEGGSAHEPDVELTGPMTLTLRAEREGKGAGRIYTAYISCADAVGNTSSTTATVTVPHDQGKRR